MRIKARIYYDGSPDTPRAPQPSNGVSFYFDFPEHTHKYFFNRLFITIVRAKRGQKNAFGEILYNGIHTINNKYYKGLMVRFIPIHCTIVLCINLTGYKRKPIL